MDQTTLYTTLANYPSADDVEKWLAEHDFMKYPLDEGPYEALWVRTESDTTGHTLHVSMLRGRQAAPIWEYDRNNRPIGQPVWLYFPPGTRNKPAAH